MRSQRRDIFHLLASVLMVLMVFFSTNVKAQQQKTPTFEGIKCAGPVPTDLRKSLDELYLEDKQRVRDYNNGRLRNRNKVLTASYYINRLMSSGRILYGDPITQMLNKIVDTLLIDNPELRKEIRVYTVKSSNVNAFSTGQGMLFVNLGLVAQVEDEAQLAFVLSHEIVHYVRKHTLETLTRKNPNRDTTDNGLNEFLRYHSRSREMESEADSLGIEMFYRNSPYDKRVAEGFFDVLQYGYLPFDEIIFDTTQYNTPYFKVSNGTFLQKVKPISARDDYNDSLSTHPNLLKRRIATTRQLAGAKGGRKYLVCDKNGFNELQTLARLECIRQDIIYAEHASAYYNCYVMLRQHPDNPYLRLAKAQAIYGAAKYRTFAAASNLSDYRNKEGEIQQVFHLMRRSTPIELCLIAINELWETHLQMPDEPRITAMAQDLMTDLHNKYNYYADNFSPTVDSTSVESQDSVSDNSKYANVKRRRRQQQKQEAYRYVFTQHMQNDSQFMPTLEEAMKKKPREKVKAGDKGTFIYAPSYYVYNDKTGERQVLDIEKGESVLTEAIKTVNDGIGYETVDFSDAAMRTHSDAEFYNDFVALNEWTNEFWQTHGRVPQIYSTQPLMDRIMQSRKADKLSLGFVTNAENIGSQLGIGYSIFFSLFGIMTPEIIYLLCTDHESTMVQNTIVDTRSGAIIGHGRAMVRRADSPSLVRSQTFALMHDGLSPKKAPGYMGKHFIIGAEAGISFPCIAISHSNSMISTRWGGEMEYVFGRNSSFSFSADWGEESFNVKNMISKVDAKMLTMRLDYRNYFGDNIAPLGPYFGIGATLTNINLTPSDPTEQLSHLESNYKRGGLMMEFGHNSIIADMFVVNLGVRYNFTFANPFESIVDYSFQKNTLRNFNADIWAYNLISLHLGIGLIPF